MSTLTEANRVDIEEESAVLSALVDRMQERLTALEQLPNLRGVVRARESLTNAIGLVGDALVSLDTIVAPDK